jgi:hypothetical protein
MKLMVNKSMDQEEWRSAVIEKQIEALSIVAPFSQRLLREAPYAAMLTLALVGVGVVSFTGQSMSLYWLVLAPLYGLMCVVAGWPRAETKEQRMRLIVKQGLHWLTFLLAMLLVTSPEVRGIENNNATGLNLMTVLASGTIVAGIHTEAWQIGIVGALLALAVPAIAWLEQSALLLVLIAVLATFMIALAFWAAHIRNI